MKPKPKRNHCLSRLERLLQASISHEVKIKSLRRELLELSARIAKIEGPPPLTPYAVGLAETMPIPLRPTHVEVWGGGKKDPTIYKLGGDFSEVIYRCGGSGLVAP